MQSSRLSIDLPLLPHFVAFSMWRVLNLFALARQGDCSSVDLAFAVSLKSSSNMAQYRFQALVAAIKWQSAI